jgi:hypothetical protein
LSKGAGLLLCSGCCPCQSLGELTLWSGFQSSGWQVVVGKDGRFQSTADIVVGLPPAQLRFRSIERLLPPVAKRNSAPRVVIRPKAQKLPIMIAESRCATVVCNESEPLGYTQRK